MRKVDRNKMIVEYRYSHPDSSLQELATLFNVSRQRVWAILKAHEEDSIELGEGNKSGC